jgi:hypothetical protein
MGRWILLATVSTLGAVGACQLVAGIDDRQLYVASIESGTDSSPTGDGGLCRGPNVPSAPDLSTSSPSDSVELLVALSKLDLGGGDAGTYGFNLDRACTCPEPDTCQRPLDKNGKKSPPACDDPGGIDNAGRALFGAFSTFINQNTFNTALTKGLSGLFLRIQNYNGLADDATVTVSVYASLGYVGYPDAGPTFDGTDVWYVDQASTENGNLDTPHYKANEAYVRDHTLIASLKFPIVLGGGNTQSVNVELESGKIVAQLDSNGSVITGVHGQLAGRWQVSKLLTSLQEAPDPFDNTKTLCGTDPTFVALKPQICNAVDIAADPTNDSTGICDAISIALGFEAVPAVFGAVKTQKPATNPCGQGYVANCP